MEIASFHVSIFLFQSPDYATQLRHSITNHVGKYWHRFSCFPSKPDGNPYRDQYEYIHTAQARCYFASHVEIQATTEKFIIAIVIYKDDQVLEFGYLDKNQKMSLRHTGSFHSGHFDLTYLPEKKNKRRKKLPSWNTTKRRHFKMAAVACLGGFADRIISKFISFSEYYVL